MHVCKFIIIIMTMHYIIILLFGDLIAITVAHTLYVTTRFPTADPF